MLEEFNNTEYDNSIFNNEEYLFDNKDIFNKIDDNDFLFYDIRGFTKPTPPIPCFLKGTKILTINGEINVEQLTDSDILITHDNRMIKPQEIIKFICKEKNSSTLPYKIPKGTLINNKKCSDNLYLSPFHQVLFYKNLFKSIKDLPFHQICCNEVQELCYYHIILPNYYTDTIIANGIVCEGFGPYFSKYFTQNKKYHRKILNYICKGKIRILLTMEEFNTFIKINNIKINFLKIDVNKNQHFLTK